MAKQWLDWADIQVSSHFNNRPAATAITMVVVHGISLPQGKFGGSAIINLLSGKAVTSNDPLFKNLDNTMVSTHFLIRRGGELIQFVPLSGRAWHAGESEYNGRENCNNYSIGIELEGEDTTPYTDWQYLSLNRLLDALSQQLPLTTIVGHSDIAAGRKTDPGPAFQWDRVKFNKSAR